MPFEIPENWEWCKLGEVTAIERGGSPRPIKAFITSEENGTNWIKIGDVERNGKYITKVKEKIIKDGEKHSRKVFPGDFLLTNSMSFGRPYISKIEGCIHDGWLVIRGNDNIYTSDYLYYYLSSAFAFNQFSESASGATVDNLSIDKVKSSWFSLPPLAEQKRIVEKVEHLFDILDKIGEAQKKYQKDKEILKSKIIESGIRGKLTKRLKSDGNASDLLDEIRKEKEMLIKEGKIKRDKKETYIYKKTSDNLYYEKYQEDTEKCIDDELPFEIPENWVWCKLNTISYNVSSKNNQILSSEVNENGKVPVISQGKELIDGYTDKQEKSIKDVPVILFGDHTRCVKYIYYCMKLIAKRIVSNGYARHHYLLLNEFLPLPPLDEQERIVEVIENILKVIN